MRKKAKYFLKDKPLHKSITFWGAIIWFITDLLGALQWIDEPVVTSLKGMAGFIIAIGIRRKLK